MGTEELVIKKLEGGIRGIKLGTKTPEEARIGYFLNKLKILNPLMYEDKFYEYSRVKEEYDKKNGIVS